MRTSQERLNEVVADIYRGAMEPGEWGSALAGVCEVLSGAAMQIYAIDPSDRSCLFQQGHDIPEQYSEQYNAFFSRHSERNKLHLARPGLDVSYDRLFFSEREMDRHDCYRWRADFGYRYYIGGPLIRTDDVWVFSAIQRSAEQGHVTPVEVRTYRMLREHLAQAIRIQDRLAELDLRFQGAWDAVERASVGVIMLSRNGLVRRCNRLARDLLERGDGLTIEKRSLRARRSIDNVRLQELIATAMSADLDRRDGNLAISRAHSDRPYSMIIAPVPKSMPFDTLEGDGVMVLLNDPDSRGGSPQELLRQHYGLTRKQVELSMALVNGCTLSEGAERLGIAEKTARRHLATIFSKTGLHRQVDLVRLVLSLPGQPN